MFGAGEGAPVELKDLGCVMKTSSLFDMEFLNPEQALSHTMLVTLERAKNTQMSFLDVLDNFLTNAPTKIDIDPPCKV